LRNSAGWPKAHIEQIETGLKNSAYIVTAKDGDITVGMARLVSDGGYVVFIVDVIVLPEYQRNGIGKNMMGHLMEHINNMLKDGYFIQVDLMAAKGKDTFYEKFGFVKRPNESYGCGFTKRIEKQIYI